MLLRFLRFCRGWVRFSVTGRYPERFINITSRSRVRLWEVLREKEGFTACMYRSDYRRIRPLARGAGVRLKLSEKGGLPYYLNRWRDRAGVLIGACVFILTVFFMSLFIWSVDVTGLETVSRTDMDAVLRENGLYVGAFKPALNAQQIARNILLQRHEVGWMAVNITGSYASVEIKEEAPAPEVEDIYTPCNVKAKCDGVILRIEAGEGETVMKEGSGVIEGQLIVSGVRTDEQGASRLVHADARVTARTTRQASFSTPETVTTLCPDGESAVRRSLMLFGLRAPYRFGAVDSPYSAVDSVTESPCPLGITLPVGVTTDRVSGLTFRGITLDNDSSEELLKREALLYETFCLPECVIETRDYRLSREDGVYTLKASYTCVEDIAVQEPIGTDENTR